MVKRLSKPKLITTILDYVFKTYCDDEQVALYIQDYYEIEKRAEERRKRKNDIKCQDKCHDKIYKITQPVRDFLEPLVDAEYFKETHYKHSKEDLNSMYSAMEQLETRQHKKLLKQIEARKKGGLNEKVG